MAAIVDYTRYNSLPSLGEADKERNALGMEDIINGPIRDVFLTHGAHRNLCLYLQHAHHRIMANEAIVKVEGTAHQMNDTEMADAISFGNRIAPTTWMSTGDEVIPMEFTVAPNEYALPSVHLVA